MYGTHVTTRCVVVIILTILAKMLANITSREVLLHLCEE